MKSKLIGKLVLIAASAQLSGCAVGAAALIGAELAVHRSPPAEIPIPDMFDALCAKDAGVHLLREVTGATGYLKMPTLWIDLEGEFAPYSTATAYRQYFSSADSRRHFLRPLPMSRSPQPGQLHFIEGYNPPEDQYEPPRRTFRIGDDGYFSGYVRKEMVERPSSLCAEHLSVFPIHETTTHCISYTRSNTPTSDYAVQESWAIIAEIPGGDDFPESTISRNVIRVYELENDETIAEKIAYSHSSSVTSLSFLSGNLLNTNSRRYAHCGGPSSNVLPRVTNEEWNSSTPLRLLGIAPH